MEDRRHWAATLARCVSDVTNTLEPTMAGWGGKWQDPEASSDEDEPKQPARVSGTGAWALAEGGSDGTWREALLELRYPQGSSYQLMAASFLMI